MTSLSYTLPTVGQPDSTEDPKIVTALSTIQSWANGSIDATNFAAAVAQALTPTGTVHPFAGTAAPAGFLMCDGSAISRTTYSALFGVVGTNFGAGDGSTTFNLPDMRGRAAVGAGPGAGLTNRALAATGGEESHLLSTGELPSHNHGVTDSGHVHNVSTVNDGGGTLPTVNGRVSIDSAGSGTAAMIARTTSGAFAIGLQAVSATTGVSVNNAGGGGSHNNMQPFLALNHIIKT